MSKLQLHSLLVDEGARQGVSDPSILLGMAQATDGPEGYEMGYGLSEQGVMDPRWRGTQRQAFGAAGMVSALEEEYTNETKQPPTDSQGVYSHEFLAYLSKDAPNPNVYFTNLTETYFTLKNRPDLLPRNEE